MFSFLEVYSLLYAFSFLISNPFIIAVFLLVILLVGVWASKGFKSLRKVMEFLQGSATVAPTELSHPLAIQLEKGLIKKLRGKRIDFSMIERAIEVIKKYHGGAKRRSGKPYFTHSLAVALITLAYSDDPAVITAALLHDALAYTSLSHIQKLFGEKVGFLVAQVTNLENRLKRVNLAAHEHLVGFMNYEEKEVALVKLADRLHGMRTIRGHSKIDKQKRIAEENLVFFVPMARYLQFMDIAQELERLSMEVLGK